MTAPSARIAENLAEVRRRIAEAAQRSGRMAADVTLVAVTKYADMEAVRGLALAGCTDLGESRPQQLCQRAEALADLPVHWHLVGHLQRNKVRRTLPQVALVHSVDSRELLEAIDRIAGELRLRPAILLEVNVSREAAKHGFPPEALPPLMETLPQFGHVEIRGLMCMAALEGDLDTARRNFAELRMLRDRLAGSAPPGVRLAELSMGMSGDYPQAVEEGATIVRVGSALFEGVGP